MLKEGRAPRVSAWGTWGVLQKHPGAVLRLLKGAELGGDSSPSDTESASALKGGGKGRVGGKGWKGKKGGKSVRGL